MTLSIEFCGQRTAVTKPGSFTIGREADLIVDDNPYLHRSFVELSQSEGLWWVRNVGDRVGGTLSALDSLVESWLPPGAVLPLVSSITNLRFSAGPTSYELTLLLDDPPSVPLSGHVPGPGTLTIGPPALNEEQLLLLVALCEPILRRPSDGVTNLPSSASVAARLGWPLTKFNRKLDNICLKLKRAGVQGLHGDIASLASSRRARLVEYALAARLVGPGDLELLGPAGGPRPEGDGSK